MVTCVVLLLAGGWEPVGAEAVVVLDVELVEEEVVGEREN